MKPIFFIIIAGLALVIAAGIAYANITRTCNAYYEISTKGRGGETITIQLGHFTTRGSCGRSVPNHCRERAKSSAIQCMANHWKIPAKADVNWQKCSDNYPINDQCLKCEIKKRMCRIFKAQTLTAQVKAITTGDKGCPQSTLIDQNFIIQCNQ